MNSKNNRFKKLPTWALAVVGGSLVVLAGLLTHSAQAACATLPTDKGTVSLTATVPTNSTYFIWSRNRTTSGSNKYYLQVDSGCGVLVGGSSTPNNTWTWVESQSSTGVELSSGNHAFKMYGVDSSLQVDRILMTADGNCVPTGTGTNCVTSTPPVTPPVIVTPDNPGTGGTGSTSGVIQVGSTDKNASSKVMIDGKLVTTGNGLLSIDTTQLSDGYHDVVVTTTNPDGTTSSVVKRILVKNNHRPWKSFYLYLYKFFGFNRPLAVVAYAMILTTIIMALGLFGYVFWAEKAWRRIPKWGFWQKNKPLNDGFTYNSLSGVPLSQEAVVGSTLPTEEPIRVFGFSTHLGHGPMTFIVSFAVIGVLLAVAGFSATNGFILDPDQGTLSGATKVTDGSASNGYYILFGTGTCPAGQTGTPPNCVTPTCPAGQTGTPPNCVTPPPQFSSQCLARSGPRINISGLQKSDYKNYSIPTNTVINATTAYWDGTDSSGSPINWLTGVGGNGPICWYGGKWNGVWDDTSPSVSWQDPYHHSAVMTIRGSSFLVEGFRANNQGDGIRMESGGMNFHIRAVYLSNIHDDCVENDFLLSGVVEDSLFDGCYTGFSSDDFTGNLNGSANTMTIQNNLMYLKPTNTVYRGPAPGTGILFKGWYQSPSEGVIINNNIFRIDSDSGLGTGKLALSAGMNIRSCSNNKIVWTGPGNFPYTYPSCFTVVKDISVWNNAVTAWKAAHPSIN